MDLKTPPRESGQAPREVEAAPQLHYARWVEFGTRACLALLLGAFALYVAGVLEPHVPLPQLPGLWVLPVDAYLAQAALGTGWSWIAHVAKGDILNVAVVAVLATVTLFAYARAGLAFLLAGERLHAALALAQIAVLAAAILGIGAGH